MMDGHRPAVWLSDRDTAQQGHGVAHQTCLAHLARDVAYAVEVSDDPVPWRCSSAHRSSPSGQVTTWRLDPAGQAADTGAAIGQHPRCLEFL